MTYWPWMTLTCHKVTKGLEGYLQVSQARSMSFHQLCLNLIRLLCPANRAVTDIENLTFDRTRDVINGVHIKFRSIFKSSRPELSDAPSPIGGQGGITTLPGIPHSGRGLNVRPEADQLSSTHSSSYKVTAHLSPPLHIISCNYWMGSLYEFYRDKFAATWLSKCGDIEHRIWLDAYPAGSCHMPA